MELSKSKYANDIVFKGGTSLTKGHKLINRFSEDVDIAVIITPDTTGNQIKTLIRTVEKEIASDLTEIEVEGVTSKGSRFRKSIYQYPERIKQRQKIGISDSINVEINSFANPFPYSKLSIQSMIGEYLQGHNQNELIEKYELQQFVVNVLNKEQIFIEKLVSLIRFSLADNLIESILGKIRHFYDLYYLLNDKDCNTYVNSEEFIKQFKKVLAHDQQQFDDPKGWKDKDFNESPLIKDFDNSWNTLKTTYTKELSMLAYSEIPDEKEVKKSFEKVIEIIKKH